MTFHAHNLESSNVHNLAKTRILEVAVSTVASLHAALAGGADRIELCAALGTGGLTPDQAFIEYSIELCFKSQVSVVVMVRPRPGSFVYDPQEIILMLRSIQLVLKTGASGVVSGALLPNGRIDPVQTQRLVDSAEALPFAFHRAFDESPQPAEDFELLHDLGVKRLLTGGGRGSASVEGLARLAQQNQHRMTLIAAGSLRPSTLSPLLDIPGLREFHSAATASANQPGNPGTNTDSKPENASSYPTDPQTDEATVRSLKKLLKGHL